MCIDASLLQDLNPRVWSDMVRVQLSVAKLQPLQPTLLGQGGKTLPAELKAHAQALESLDEVVSSFMRLRDVEGVHYAAKLIWNTGK